METLISKIHWSINTDINPVTCSRYFCHPSFDSDLKDIVHAHSYKSTSICHIEGKENLNRHARITMLIVVFNSDRQYFCISKLKKKQFCS